MIAQRPMHGEPRPYQFPRFERGALSNGLGLITVHLPGRALLTACFGLVHGLAAGIGGGSGRLRRVQNGFVRSYALSMFGGAALVVAALLLVRVGA
mgnify:CR=1 FL=1